MDGYERTSSGLKLNTFDGDVSKLYIWQMRFQAYAIVKIFSVGLET